MYALSPALLRIERAVADGCSILELVDALGLELMLACAPVSPETDPGFTWAVGAYIAIPLGELSCPAIRRAALRACCAASVRPADHGWGRIEGAQGVYIATLIEARHGLPTPPKANELARARALVERYASIAREVRHHPAAPRPEAATVTS